MTWDHVYLEPKEVHPHGYVSLDKKETKSGEGRQVPLSPAAAKVFKKQAKVRDRENPVFVGRTGRANPDIRNGWEEVKREAALDGLGFGHERLKGLHFHDLRASWAVDSLGRGAHFLQIKTVGGWSSITAMQRYLRCVEDDMSSLHKAYRNRNKRQKAS